MGANTKIEWCDHTFNGWIGCSKVSPGCAHCYAETLDRNRFSKTLGGATKAAPVSHWGKSAPRHRTSASNWRQPLRWNQEAGERESLASQFSGHATHKRPRVFCSSLADWLDDEVPLEWLADLLELIRETPNLDWLLLTKRPQNWRSRLELVAALWPDSCQRWVHFGEAPANVWIGTTVEDQQRADERIPILLTIPARVRFLSCEPMLGPVTLDAACFSGPGASGTMDGIHWVICGGESGPGARPMHPEWARSLRDQCAAASVPFLWKQWGEWLPDDQRRFRTSGDITWGLVHHSGKFRLCLDKGKRLPGSDVSWLDGEWGTTRVGKATAGRLLDGIEHNGFPEVQHAAR